uniref:Uncharacterized protein n=1 Tax=Panstrongylus lignarius TaxID=156445 RepID=A0A224XQB2_9HEMI
MAADLFLVFAKWTLSMCSCVQLLLDTNRSLFLVFFFVILYGPYIPVSWLDEVSCREHKWMFPLVSCSRQIYVLHHIWVDDYNKLWYAHIVGIFGIVVFPSFYLVLPF